ncbi:MAG: DeoR family transcriptional regulator [Eubacterium sp.]|nr:DeoR family transcriptional regulator [Eubacterium sp.]
MEELLELLKDGKTRTTQMLANELNTTENDIQRKLEFLENAGIIKREVVSAEQCSGGCGGGCGEKCGCSGCVPDTGMTIQYFRYLL